MFIEEKFGRGIRYVNSRYVRRVEQRGDGVYAVMDDEEMIEVKGEQFLEPIQMVPASPGWVRLDLGYEDGLSSGVVVAPVVMWKVLSSIIETSPPIPVSVGPESGTWAVRQEGSERVYDRHGDSYANPTAWVEAMRKQERARRAELPAD